MSLYGKIVDEFQEKIVSGELKPGERLPSVTQLKEKYRVSQPVALRVYRELCDKGLAESRPRLGCFVKKNPRNELTGRIAVFTRSMKAPDTVDNYFNEINIGIMMSAAMEGVDLLHSKSARTLLRAYFSEDKLSEVEKAMLRCADDVDGYILDERIPDYLLARVLTRIKKPMLMVNRPSTLPISSICPDNEKAIDELIDMGRKMKYTQFVFCAHGNPELYSDLNFNSADREAAFRKYLPNDNFELISDCLTAPQEICMRRIDEVCRRRRQMGRTLVIATRDELAAELIKTYAVNGKTPEDLGIAGLGGIAVRNTVVPNIADMQIDAINMGERAMESLLKSISQSEGQQIFSLRMPMTFVAGDSM